MFETILKMDSDKWEEYCHKLLKLKYGIDYQTVPQTDGEDYGIKGFTQSGQVFQYYAPDSNYSIKLESDLMRDKITEDLIKLEENGKTIMKNLLDGEKIVRWIFVIPSYKTKTVLEHLIKKKREIKEKKYAFIDENFNASIMDYEHFTQEIMQLSRIEDNYKYKFKFDYKKEVNWEEYLDSYQMENLKSKLSVICNNSSDLNILMKVYIKFYACGIDFIKFTRKFKDLYDELINFKELYEADVEIKSVIKNYTSIKTFTSEVTNDLIINLKENFKYIDSITIKGIANMFVSQWLLDCPLELRSREEEQNV